jgi:hypothetical protein
VYGPKSAQLVQVLCYVGAGAIEIAEIDGPRGPAGLARGLRLVAANHQGDPMMKLSLLLFWAVLASIDLAPAAD